MIWYTWTVERVARWRRWSEHLQAPELAVLPPPPHDLHLASDCTYTSLAALLSTKHYKKTLCAIKTCHFYFLNSSVKRWPILLILACNIMKKRDTNDYSFAHLTLILSLHYLVKCRSCSLAVCNNEFILDIMSHTSFFTAHCVHIFYCRHYHHHHYHPQQQQHRVYILLLTKKIQDFSRTLQNHKNVFTKTSLGRQRLN